MSNVQNFTLEGAGHKLTELGKSAGTLRSYKGKWEIIAKTFPEKQSLKNGFASVDNVIAFIYAKSESPSTRKTYLSAYKALLDLYDYPARTRKKVSELIKQEQENSTIQQAIKNQTPPFSLEDAKEMFQKLDELFKKAIKKASKEKEYGNATMLASYLFLILKHGVLRSDELSSLIISDKPLKDVNSISKTGVLTIIHHKNEKSLGTVTTKIDKKIIPLISKAPEGVPFIHQLSKPVNGVYTAYQSGDGVSKMLKRQIGYLNHTIRDAKTSIVLNSESPERRQALRHYQMHSLDTQLTHYTKHSGGAAEEVFGNDLIKEE
jgi:hypothetical protein